MQKHTEDKKELLNSVVKCGPIEDTCPFVQQITYFHAIIVELITDKRRQK